MIKIDEQMQAIDEIMRTICPVKAELAAYCGL